MKMIFPIYDLAKKNTNWNQLSIKDWFIKVHNGWGTEERLIMNQWLFWRLQLPSHKDLIQKILPADFSPKEDVIHEDFNQGFYIGALIDIIRIRIS